MADFAGNIAEDMEIGGTTILPGKIHEIRIKLSESYGSTPVYMPITVVRGIMPGPTVCLTGAVHGDEINGVEIVRQVSYALDPERMRGTVISVPIVNVPGFNNRTRHLPDGRDLNRTFPGTPHGSQTSRIADTLFREIIRKSQYSIDFHTATAGRRNMPHIRADVEHQETRRIARAFGSRVILHGRGRKGSLRKEAVRAKIASIVFEVGEADRFEADAVRKGIQGACNVLSELHVIDDWKKVEPPYQVIVKAGEWIRADRGGIINVLPKPGDLVYSGDEIGVISNPYGRELTSVKAPFTGLVVGLTVTPLVNPGSPVCHLVKLDKTLPIVEAALQEKTER